MRLRDFLPTVPVKLYAIVYMVCDTNLIQTEDDGIFNNVLHWIDRMMKSKGYRRKSASN